MSCAQPGVAEAVPDLAVLAQNRHLLFLRQGVEFALAAQRIPDVPFPLGIRDHLARTVEQPVFEVRLVADASMSGPSSCTRA